MRYERITPQFFIEVYYTIRKDICKDHFIRHPNFNGKVYTTIEEVCNLINTLNADIFHFLGFAVRYYATLRLFPSPSHLLSTKLIEKYKYHQALKNVYNYSSYAISGDDVVIYATQEIVSLSKEINSPFEQDIRFRYISHLIPDGYTNHNQSDIIQVWYSAHYSKVKLEHKKRVIPDNIIKFIDSIEKQIGIGEYKYAKGH